MTSVLDVPRSRSDLWAPGVARPRAIVNPTLRVLAAGLARYPSRLPLDGCLCPDVRAPGYRPLVLIGGRLRWNASPSVQNVSLMGAGGRSWIKSHRPVWFAAGQVRYLIGAVAPRRTIGIARRAWRLWGACWCSIRVHRASRIADEHDGARTVSGSSGQSQSVRLSECSVS